MALAQQGDEVKPPRIPSEEIVARFDAVPGTWDERKASEAMRGAFQNLAAAINDDIVDSRAKAEALTLLESASMWTQKAIFEELPAKKKEFPDLPPAPQRIFIWMGGRDERLIEFLGEAFKELASENVPGRAKDRHVLTYTNTIGETSVIDDDRARTFEKLVNGRIYLHQD